MRSFLTIFGLLCLLPTFASAGAVKGVRGTKRFHPVGRSLKEEKKCKKFKEPKAVKETVGEPKAAKETVAEPKAMKETVAEPKAVKETATEPKAVKETAAEPKAVKETVAEPKAVKETVAPKADPKADKVGIKAEEELECLEWEEASDRDDSSSDSTIVTEGAFGSTGTSTDFQSVNVDCDAIANDSGPTDTHSVSFSVNIDLLKDADTGLQDIYSAMEKELQTKVAPRVAGCSSGRMLAEDSTKIVNVDFGDFKLSNRGCDSSLAKEAAERDGICSSSDIPVDVYFVGDFPASAIAKVEVAIEEHEWNIDGLMDTSEVEVVQTASSMGDSDGLPPAVFAGIGVAVLVALVAGFCIYKRRQNDAPVAKAELDTDEESDDEKDKYKNGVQEVEAKPVGRW